MSGKILLVSSALAALFSTQVYAQDTGLHLYMFQFKNSQQSNKAHIENPQDRAIPVRKLLEGFGGKLIAYYFYLGSTNQYDGMTIVELPNDNVARQLDMYVRSTGAVETENVVPLATTEQWKSMMEQTKQTRTGYTPPAETKQ